MTSACHKSELRKAPLIANKQKCGYIFYCPTCLDILYYEGQFLWSGWHMRHGIKGFGCYYGKLIKKGSESSTLSTPKASRNSIPSHGLIRKDLMAQNAYVKED